jgi:hypothetical protein
LPLRQCGAANSDTRFCDNGGCSSSCCPGLSLDPMLLIRQRRSKSGRSVSLSAMAFKDDVGDKSLARENGADTLRHIAPSQFPLYFVSEGSKITALLALWRLARYWATIWPP